MSYWQNRDKRIPAGRVGILLLFFISLEVRAQQPPTFVQNDIQHKINLYDVNGHPLVNAAIETKGSPLFLSKWKLGWIRTADNRFFGSVLLQLDLEKQQVHYKRSDGADVAVEPGQVKDLAILDTIAGATVVYQFSSGYPAIDNRSGVDFYLFLDSGRVSLLESMRKEVYQEKDDFSGDSRREYKIYNDFYVFSMGKLARIKKDPKFFLELTKDKRGQMEDYLQKTKISFRSIDDIRQFIHYYNGLP
jgi:hypothetical protein